MRLLVFLSLFFIFISSGFSQEMLDVQIFTADYVTDKKEGGVTVKVFDGSSLIGTYVSPANGKVNFQLPVGKSYKVEASKTGKVTRFITVNAKGINTELLPANSTPSVVFQFGLFNETPGVDYSGITSNQATEYYFDGSNPELQYDDIIAKRMKAKVEKALKDADATKGQSEAQYNAAIKEADAFYTQKKYQEALASYEKALKIKPTEAHPNQRLVEIDGILKAQKANAQDNAQAESEYQGLITAADNLFNQKKYEEAIVRYNEAFAKKQEDYPKEQIKKADAEILRLKTEAENAGKYTDAIKAADGFLAQKSYNSAKDNYKTALKFKKDDPYATGKLAEIEGKLNAQKTEQDKKKKYDDANAAADLLFDEQKWAEAKVKYKEALVIEPSSVYTQGRISEIDVKLAELEKEKAKGEQITKLLAEGNTAFVSSQWAPSKAKYQEVLKLDDKNAVAIGRLAEIEVKLNEEKADADKLTKIKTLVAEGDALAKQSKLAEAKAKYQEAVALKPDALIQGKIDSIDSQLAAAGQKAEKKAKYDKALADGEVLFTAQKYEEAKAKFQEALDLDPAQAVPKQRIIDADKKLAESLAATQKNEKYMAALTAGNNALAAQNLAEAKAKYQEAIAVDNTKPEAKEKLAQVETLLANDAKAKENQAKYLAAVKAGEELLSASKLSEAKVKFTEAAALDPSQALPKQKLADIEVLVAQAEKQKQIDGLLNEGTAALNKKDLVNARAKFQQVLTLDPPNAIAAAKMQEVAKLENDMAGEAQKEARFKQLKDEAAALMTQAKYQEAKQKLTETQTIKADAGVDQMIKECNSKIAELAKGEENDKLYTTAIAEGQLLESSKDYDKAIAKYNEALKIKNEQLPKDRIAAINQLKAANANQAKTDAEYAALMKKGDDAFDAKNYLAAIPFYNQALTLKPNEQEPVRKATEAERLEKGKGDDFMVQYQKVLDVAQKAMNEKNYTKAKEMYNRALTLKADDPFPNQQLAEIDRLMKAEKEAQEKLTAYTKKVGEAEAAASAGKTEGAIVLFQQAKTIKPDEVLPDNRIAELRTKLEGNNAALAESEKRYQALMSEGNNAAAGKDYQVALGKYQEALSVKKNDKYAEGKIGEMRQLLDDLAKSGAKNADIQKLLVKADGEFGNKKWMDAKAIYEKVLVIDPTNAYAAEQSRLCDSNAVIEGKDNDNRNYLKIISKADENFDRKDYDKAKDYYQRALTFRASDPYPKKRLDDIDAILNPTPVKPVVVSNEPQPLEKLGDPNNAIADNALQNAENIRKQRKTLRHNRRVENAQNQDTLAGRKSASITATNEKLAQVEIDNSKSSIAADDNRQVTVQVLGEGEKKLGDDETQSAQYKNANLLNAKNEINTADRISTEQNSVLDGGYAENTEVLKKSNTVMQDGIVVTEKQVYITQLDNKTQFNAVEVKIGEIDLDDNEERLASEKLVRENVQAVIDVEAENSERTDVTLKEIKQTVDDVNSLQSDIEAENSKQAPANQEVVRAIDKDMDEMNSNDYDGHVTNSLEVRKSLEIVDQDIAASYDKSDDSRKNNVEVMKSSVQSQEELDRISYNSMMVKSINTDGALRTEKIRQQEIEENAAKPADQNAEALRIIGKEQEERTVASDAKEDDKRQNNQQSLIRHSQTIEEMAVVGSDKSRTNEEILKENRKNQAATDTDMGKSQDTKNQAANQQIAAIEKKEIVYETASNDIGKLYPEGVSQEQFEQNDNDGLLQAVVTRRVVVKNGHGDVYVRTQTLSGLTYSKNGQPSTEYAWQRETQDATLVKNY